MSDVQTPGGVRLARSDCDTCPSVRSSYALDKTTFLVSFNRFPCAGDGFNGITCGVLGGECFVECWALTPPPLASRPDAPARPCVYACVLP